MEGNGIGARLAADGMLENWRDGLKAFDWKLEIEAEGWKAREKVGGLDRRLGSGRLEGGMEG